MCLNDLIRREQEVRHVEYIFIGLWSSQANVTVCCIWRRGRVLNYKWNLFQRSLCQLHGRLRVSLWSGLWTHSTEDFLSRFSFYSNTSSSSSVTRLQRLLVIVTVPSHIHWSLSYCCKFWYRKNLNVIVIVLSRGRLMHFLVYMYYTHSGYKTSIFGKNHVCYIWIFTVTYRTDFIRPFVVIRKALSFADELFYQLFA